MTLHHYFMVKRLGGHAMKWEASKEAVAVIQAREHHSLDQGRGEGLREEDALSYRKWKGKRQDLPMREKEGETIKTEISGL